jgi:hypothetical protein
VELLGTFKLIEFNEQYRSDDPYHTSTINQMRTLDRPITQSIVDRLQVLTKEDILQDPSWLDAPIVVCSNKERSALNLTQSTRFAIRNNVPILQWKREISNSVADTLGDVGCDLLYDNEPDLTGIFVQGAPGFLNNNLNPTEGLANGTPIVLHSITFSDDVDQEQYIHLIENATPGAFVDIPAPRTVNVLVPSLDLDEWLRAGHLSLSTTDVVIPLVYKSCEKSLITVDSQHIYYKSHMHDLAFAVTFHKMQGQTVKKIILDINCRPTSLGSLDFHAFYVGISRVKQGTNIRILPCQDNKKFKHLLHLYPDENLKPWLESFERVE